jgi:23S rRNA (adenine2030-N6)-methyltransferase
MGACPSSAPTVVHYRHSYHAGNFADVFKHVLLVGLLSALNRKDKPWCYLESHAGAGDYDLGGEGASRTLEWQDGVGRLQDEAGAPELVREYLRLLAAARSQGHADRYPGSPLFARALARPDDRLVLCEKVPEVAAELKHALRGDPRAAVHLRDGYEAHALLPPAEKRGLVLIDPPFERTDELDAMAELIVKSVARFAGGVYAAWYPVKNHHRVLRFARRVAQECGKPVLNLEFDTGAEADDEIHFASTDRPAARPQRPGRPSPARRHDPSPGIVRIAEKKIMHACGLLVVNPPFGFDQAAAAALQWLKPRLAQGPRAGFTLTHAGEGGDPLPADAPPVGRGRREAAGEGRRGERPKPAPDSRPRPPGGGRKPLRKN